MFRSLFLVSPLLIAAGCSCNQDYSFPPVEPPEFEAPPDHGSWLSMGTAPDDARLTMSYYDRETTGIGFAVGSIADDGSIEWLHEQVDGYPENGLDPGDYGKYTSQATAPDGRVFAAYQDSTNGSLRVGIRTGPGVWERETVDTGEGSAGAWNSLAIQSNGLPMIAHHDAETGTLRVTRMTEAGWESETAWTGGVGSYADLFIHEDTAYIAFYNAIQGNLELLEGGFGAWSHSEIDTNGEVGQWPSLYADADQVLVAYHHVGDQDLKFARRAGGSWDAGVIDAGEYRGADTALFMTNGEPNIVYFDGENNDMWIARNTGGTWTTEKVAGDDGAVGFHNEVAQVGGRWFVGSYDFSHRNLFTTEL